jgi:hypothetical protein
LYQDLAQIRREDVTTKREIGLSLERFQSPGARNWTMTKARFGKGVAGALVALAVVLAAATPAAARVVIGFGFGVGPYWGYPYYPYAYYPYPAYYPYYSYSYPYPYTYAYGYPYYRPRVVHHRKHHVKARATTRCAC